MPYSENLYFIALIPKRELREKIIFLKMILQTDSNSNKSFKSLSTHYIESAFKQNYR